MQVGARGQDEQGAIFVSSLKRSSVDVSKLRVGKGSTGTASLPTTVSIVLLPACMHQVPAVHVSVQGDVSS